MNEDYSFRAEKDHGGSAFRLAGVLSNRSEGVKEGLSAIERTYYFRAIQAWREVWPVTLDEIFGAESTRIDAVKEEKVGADTLVRFTVQCNIPERNLVWSNLSLVLWPDKSWVVREVKHPRGPGTTTLTITYNELPDGQLETREYKRVHEYPTYRRKEHYVFTVDSMESKSSPAGDFRLAALGLPEPSPPMHAQVYWTPYICFGLAAVSLAAGLMIRRKSS
jgi:hypothetical protein